MIRRWFLVLVTALLAFAVHASRPDALDPLPRWDYKELISAATAGLAAEEIKDVRLLAWQTQEDGRPLRFDAALLWVHTNLRTIGEKWLLVKLVRHPLDRDGGRQWVTSFEGHSWEPVKVFDIRPSNRDVYAFLKDHWEFSPSGQTVKGSQLTDNGYVAVRWKDFRILEAGVRTRTWRYAIGEEPVRFHKGERRK